MFEELISKFRILSIGVLYLKMTRFSQFNDRYLEVMFIHYLTMLRCS